MPEVLACRILMFMWSCGPLLQLLLFMEVESESVDTHGRSFKAEFPTLDFAVMWEFPTIRGPDIVGPFLSGHPPKGHPMFTETAIYAGGMRAQGAALPVQSRH